MFEIKTEVLGNIDHGQDPSLPPYGVEIEILRAENFQDLKEMVREWQYENDIGGGNWTHPPLKLDGKVVGYMSYNGRVWKDKSITNTTEEVKF